MLISRKSMFSGVVHNREMPTVTEEKLKRWRHGELIQNVFPELSAEDREFLMTGVTAEEWEEEFGQTEEGC